MVADGFVDLLEAGAEAFVDFCRVPFPTDSKFSGPIDSETTFFGLPLFFATSADILFVSGGQVLSMPLVLSVGDQIIPRVTIKGDAT